MTIDTTITKQTIPLLDLNAQYQGLEDDIVAATLVTENGEVKHEGLSAQLAGNA